MATAAKKASPRKAAPRKSAAAKPVNGRQPGDKYHEIAVEVIPARKPLRATIGDREIVVEAPGINELREIMTVSHTLDEVAEIMLGAQAPELVEWFEDKPATWIAFASIMQNYFFGPGTDDVEGKSRDSSDS